MGITCIWGLSKSSFSYSKGPERYETKFSLQNREVRANVIVIAIRISVNIVLHIYSV